MNRLEFLDLLMKMKKNYQLFKTFEILIDDLYLPKRKLPIEIELHNLRNRAEFNKTLNLFLEIFPNEIESEKAENLRDFRETEYKGIFIAKKNDEIIGFLISGKSGFVGYILYLGVKEEYKSQGIATNLLLNFKKDLEPQNIGTIHCKVKIDNIKTLGYINYLGFKEI